MNGENLPVPPVKIKDVDVDRHLLSATLPMLFRLENCYEGLDGNKRIRVDEILACPWNENRLERTRGFRRLDRDPLNLTAVRIGKKQWFYIPNDGNHRAAIAIEKGMVRLWAKISGHNIIFPEDFVYDQSTGIIWYQTDEPGVLQWVQSTLLDGQLDLLLLLGIQSMESLDKMQLPIL